MAPTLMGNSHALLFKVNEERNKRVKELIGRIPTDKESLFNFNIEWSQVRLTDWALWTYGSCTVLIGAGAS
jgi:hypothetical protein